MHRWILAALAGLGLFLGCARPALAYNPHVTLRVQDATGLEILTKLGEAVKLDFSLPDPPFRSLDQLQAALSMRHSFNWERVRLTQVLAQFSQRFGTRFQVRPSGHYYVYANDPGVAPAGAPAAAPAGNGVVVKATRLSLRTEASLRLEPAVREDNSGSLQVSLSIDPTQTDVGVLARLQNVVARDDLGNILRGETFDLPSLRRQGQAGPISYSVTFPEPEPRAKRLVWVQGDLYASIDVQRTELEIPLPLPPGGVKKQFQGTEWEFLSVKEFALPGDSIGPANRVEVQASFTVPPGLPIRDALTEAPMYLRGLSGRIIDGGGRSLRGNGSTFRVEKTFHQVREPLRSLALVFITPDEPRRVQTVRLTDLPIPRYTPTAAQPAARPSFPVRRSVPDPQPEEKGTATLVSRVTLGAIPATSGKMEVGLAAQDGDGWGPLRWRQVELDDRGEVRIAELKSGRYRLLRRYWPAPGASPSAAWIWRGEEVIVQLLEGKETHVPPLTGSAPPAPSPAPSRPAGPRPSKPPARKAP